LRLLDRVQTATDKLTQAERRLVTSVMSQPRKSALGTVTDLARAADVHEATVSRMVRKLGYDGFPAFRHALQQEFIPSQEIAALSRAAEFVLEAEIQQAAEKLMSARRIFIYGHGNAEILALLAEKRFRRYGRDVHTLEGDARDMAETALAMARGDVLLCFAFRRPPRHYAALAEHARALGVATIAVTGLSGRLLSPAPDQLISAPRSEDAAAFQSLTVPMAITNAIIIAAGALNETTALKTLETLGHLIKRFE
jgi:DNA-binding MurR/RpiR family transcriptional regulator